VADYSDVSSGWTDQRKQLKCMLADLATASDISYVIVPEHSMVARNMQVYARIVWKIEQAGARLIVASTPLEDYPGMKSNPLGFQQAVADWANNETPETPVRRRIRRRAIPPDPAGQHGGESTGTSTDKEVRHD
jgi:DNA invertase Pin-like site-specific DNA recombinase